MASAARRYGMKHIVQMRKLTLFYSPKGGSSKGCREFINKDFVKFASERPSSVFTATTIPDSRHPHFLVEYLNGRGYKVDLKNLSDKEVLEHATILSTSSGKKHKKLQQVSKSVRIYTQSPTPSVSEFLVPALL
eukprot:m.53794 g.53794  ORF g.53794 m.53794 type:complete len:134 (-) comp15464_c0_seq2:83-484(-)